jgi:hypothetical protein
MNSLVLPLNGKYVSVHFTFDVGYEATWDEPGCPDDCEIAHVYYPHDSDAQVDILPVMHEDDIKDLYNRIYNYRGEDDV